MTAPFKLPAYLSRGLSHDPVLCAADCELICELEGSTEEEAEYILLAINERPQLLSAIADHAMLDDIEVKALHAIADRLYDGTALSFENRRDLAAMVMRIVPR